MFLVIDHHICPQTKFPQCVDPFKILFQGSVIVHYCVDYGVLVPGVFGILFLHLELWQDDILVLVTIPGKVELFDLDLVQHLDLLRSHHSDVKTLVEVYHCLGSYQLIQEVFPILTGKDVWITENNVLLPIPKL